MTLSELLENNGIAKSHIAQMIGMNESTFKNKLREGHSAHFTPAELVAIYEALDEIIRNLRKFITEV